MQKMKLVMVGNGMAGVRAPTCVQSMPVNNRRNCAAFSVTAPSCTGGQVKAPLSRRFVTRHRPDPSQINSFSRSDRLERKMKTSPANGSAASAWATCARVCAEVAPWADEVAEVEATAAVDWTIEWLTKTSATPAPTAITERTATEGRTLRRVRARASARELIARRAATRWFEARSSSAMRGPESGVAIGCVERWLLRMAQLSPESTELAPVVEWTADVRVAGIDCDVTTDLGALAEMSLCSREISPWIVARSPERRFACSALVLVGTVVRLVFADVAAGDVVGDAW
jgi:hypothetical protein